MIETATTDNQGRHNASIEASFSRILESNTWKKQRVVVVLPSSMMISAKVALSHWNLIFPPNQAMYRMLVLGHEVGDAYSSAIEQIIAHPELSQWEFILTIESDNMPPGDGLLRLIKAMEEHPEYACIGGLYWTKGEGGVPQVWGDPKDPMLNFRPQTPPLDGEIKECNGTGMGFNLWRISMFKDQKLPRPLFQTKASAEGVGTQDLAFWTEAKKLGYRCAISGDVKVGHLDVATGIVW
jgi:hypothetical protein